MAASFNVSSERTVKCHKKGSLATVIFHTAMLDFQTLLWFHDIIVDLSASTDIKEVHIESAGKNFLIGADVEYLTSAIEQRRQDRIMAYSDLGNLCFDALQDLKAVTVAKVSGTALGGGFELALACDYRVVTPTAGFSLPELRLGIFPQWGGIERLCERIPMPLAKWIVFTCKSVSAGLAKELGIADVLMEPGDFAERKELGFAKPARTKGIAGRPVSGEVPEHLAATADFFSRSLTEMVHGVPGEVLTAEQQRYRRYLRGLSLVSLRYADRVFDAVRKYPPFMVRQMKDTVTWDTYHTQDAYIGLCFVRDGKLGVPPFTQACAR